jgi:hypothetical protein
MHFPRVSINAIVFFQADLFLFAVNTWSEFLKIPFSHEREDQDAKGKYRSFCQIIISEFLHSAQFWHLFPGF